MDVCRRRADLPAHTRWHGAYDQRRWFTLPRLSTGSAIRPALLAEPRLRVHGAGHRAGVADRGRPTRQSRPDAGACHGQVRLVVHLPAVLSFPSADVPLPAQLPGRWLDRDHRARLLRVDQCRRASGAASRATGRPRRRAVAAADEHVGPRGGCLRGGCFDGAARPHRVAVLRPHCIRSARPG